MPDQDFEKKSAINRRNFLKSASMLGLGAGLLPLGASEAVTSSHHLTTDSNDSSFAPQSGTLTLLQTTDVHCQIHPHDELFWENDRAVFRKTAGYAQLATLLDKIRKQNPTAWFQRIASPR